jgi:hypothetical protein
MWDRFIFWPCNNKGYRAGYRWALGGEGNTISNKPFGGSQVDDYYYSEWHKGFYAGKARIERVRIQIIPG